MWIISQQQLTPSILKACHSRARKKKWIENNFEPHFLFNDTSSSYLFNFLLFSFHVFWSLYSFPFTFAAHDSNFTENRDKWLVFLVIFHCKKQKKILEQSWLSFFFELPFLEVLRKFVFYELNRIKRQKVKSKEGIFVEMAISLFWN